jgi:hypothetical protein
VPVRVEGPGVRVERLGQGICPATGWQLCTSPKRTKSSGSWSTSASTSNAGWKAVTLPIDQLVLTLAQDVFTNPADLALAHKLALVLGKAANDHADWRLPELTSELAVIAKNERRFIGFSSDDSGFDPERHSGKVVVTTMHKAKGLEWERVHLMSVNNYDFPVAATL